MFAAVFGVCIKLFYFSTANCLLVFGSPEGERTGEWMTGVGPSRGHPAGKGTIFASSDPPRIVNWRLISTS
jgi:hypothetical protein